MKKNILCFLLICSVACLQVGCDYEKDVVLNDTESGSSAGSDEDDLVEEQTWTSSLDIVWNGSSATVSGSVSGVTVTNNSGYVTITSTVDVFMLRYFSRLMAGKGRII